jgi:hypothetical protein
MRLKVRSAWFSLIAVSVVSSVHAIPIGVGDLAHNRPRVEARASKCSHSKTAVQRQARNEKAPRIFRWVL